MAGGCGVEQSLLLEMDAGDRMEGLHGGGEGGEAVVDPADGLGSGWKHAPLSPAFLRTRSMEKQGEGQPGQGAGFRPAPWDHSHLGSLAQIGAQTNDGDEGQWLAPAFQQRLKEALPAAYDSRTMNRTPPARNQGNCGSCWAFAALGTLEINLMPQMSRDFSENNMKNRHGFDAWHCDGGNYLMAAAYLNRFDGPVLEEEDPYNANSSVSTVNLTPSYYVREFRMLPDRSGPLDNDLIKAAVRQYGSVATTMYSNSSSSYNSEAFAYYYNGSAEPDHGIVIVGWDDNFSSSNFASPPPGDGAFIIRNSWGEEWGDGGYFYISYYDAIIGQHNAVFPSLSEEPLYDYAYMYDPLGFVQSWGDSSETAWAANVFTTSSREHLKAISIISVGDILSYEAYIYVNPDLTPIDGALAGSMEGTLHGAGYHEISVADLGIVLNEGERFAVVVKFTTPGYEYPVPVEMPVSGYSSGASAGAGESYGSLDGVGWFDVLQMSPDLNVCIRAFTDAACDDDNVCTVDSWNGIACEHDPVEDGTVCDSDGDGCTVVDACGGGVCVPGSAADCGGGGVGGGGGGRRLGGGGGISAMWACV